MLSVDLMARYGLVIVLAWFGGLKFMDYEAQGIAPLVSESPFMSWLYDIFSVYAFSALLGVFEIAAALLLAVKPWWPKASIFGSRSRSCCSSQRSASCSPRRACSTRPQDGFPPLSLTGGFLIKDIALLGISAWTLADALGAANLSTPNSSRTRRLSSADAIAMPDDRRDDQHRDVQRRSSGVPISSPRSALTS